MNEKDTILRIMEEERERLFGTEETREPEILLRPDPRDEIDRMGKALAERLLEAGVTECL